MRILLVDDNDLNRELFTDVLTADGHEVDAERDGTRGLALGLNSRYDVILLDLHLLGIGGEQVCRDLRTAGVTSSIIAVSASAMPDEVARALPAGFDAFLRKPIAPSLLREAVRDHLAFRTGARTS